MNQLLLQQEVRHVGLQAEPNSDFNLPFDEQPARQAIRRNQIFMHKQVQVDPRELENNDEFFSLDAAMRNQMQ